MLIRTFAGCCALSLALVAAGCGGDEEPASSTAPTAPVVDTDRVQTAKIPEPETETEAGGEATGPDAGETSPEDQPGGAGDEEPARSEVVLEFSREGLSPTEVRVAPFIPVVLVIRSDGTEYDLTYTAPSAGGGAAGSTEADFEIDGLRPDQEIVVRERNTDSVVRIRPAHEAGP